ncbi:pilus assembly protein PilP [Marinihelvus fidelis]|uniref:Pilus assembly protein PilP n=1 Tax=Marinihelvus fidelis TaxID=2613842 RepID=A0A5N0TAV1_9GAMM|nr:pilus assembly protein PilP [Marinihelvus fidelis]KAA9131267.1 pilus assembly protein PilP [Marinihelvus fidelis]
MKSVNRTMTRALLVITATTVLASCSRDMGELEQYIAEVKARPAQPIPPIPPVKTYKPYAYEGTNGRDPFQSSTSQGRESAAASSGDADGPKPDFDRPKEYLERYELDTLTMVGTFSRDNAYWGLVRDPDGVVHRVTVNDYMGKNHGRIVQITEAAIDLSEFIPNGDSGWLVREASIALEGN